MTGKERSVREAREGRGVRRADTLLYFTARAHGSVVPANGLSSGHLGSPIIP